MTNAKISPYGSWKSPITSELIVREAVGLSQVQFDDDDIYWIELRPSEGGRHVVVRHSPDGGLTDITPAQFNARTRVHEYGGGDYVVADGTVYFSNFADQKLYRQPLNSLPESIVTTSNQNAGNDGEVRYADAIVDKTRNRLVCVREDHTDPNREAVNSLAAISLATGDTRVLASGNDFIHLRGLTRMDRNWPGLPGITQTCRGMAASCGSLISLPTDHWQTNSRLSVVCMNRSSSPNGHLMEYYTLFPIRVAGGISIARTPTDLSNVFARWTQSLVCRNGSLGCRLTHSRQLTVLSVLMLKKGFG